MDHIDAIRGRVHELIRSEPGIARDEIAERLGVREGDVQPALRALLDDHVIFEMSVGTVGGDRFATID